MIRSLLRQARRWMRHHEENYLYASSVEALLRHTTHLGDPLQVLVVDAHNIGFVLPRRPAFPPLFRTRVLRGDVAIMALLEEEWIFRSLAVLGPNSCPVTGYPLQLSATDAFLECAETHPAWRGKGVAPSMLFPTALELLAHGITRVFFTVDPTNAPSIRAMEKGGAERQGLIVADRWLGRWHTKYTVVAPSGVEA